VWWKNMMMMFVWKGRRWAKFEESWMLCCSERKGWR
jgi:hypothetical protein